MQSLELSQDIWRHKPDKLERHIADQSVVAFLVLGVGHLFTIRALPKVLQRQRNLLMLTHAVYVDGCVLTENTEFRLVPGRLMRIASLGNVADGYTSLTANTAEKVRSVTDPAPYHFFPLFLAADVLADYEIDVQFALRTLA